MQDPVFLLNSMLWGSLCDTDTTMLGYWGETKLQDLGDCYQTVIWVKDPFQGLGWHVSNGRYYSESFSSSSTVFQRRVVPLVSLDHWFSGFTWPSYSFTFKSAESLSWMKWQKNVSGTTVKEAVLHWVASAFRTTNSFGVLSNTRNKTDSWGHVTLDTGREPTHLKQRKPRAEPNSSPSEALQMRVTPRPQRTHKETRVCISTAKFWGEQFGSI